MTSSPNRLRTLTAALTIALASTSAFAQRGGGRGGGAPAAVAQVETRSRLQILTDVLVLDNDQKKQVKAIMDAAHKSATPVRAELIKTRAALAAAVQGGKGEAELDAAAKNYAAQVTAMTGIEMKALGQILSPLTPEERQQRASPAFYLMRGAFLDNRWDEAPEGKIY